MTRADRARHAARLTRALAASRARDGDALFRALRAAIYRVTPGRQRARHIDRLVATGVAAASDALRKA